jgi:proteasome lid subunit RPN8/RPN11
MALYLAECARESIVQHGEGGYPDEICGVLLGKEIDGKRTIRTLMPIENQFEEGERYHRYLITPQAMLRAERLARHERLDVLGVYHSHPNAEAQPSEYDRDHAAWTAWSYLIVSVRDGKATGVRAWKLREDRSGFDEETVIVGEA